MQDLFLAQCSIELKGGRSRLEGQRAPSARKNSPDRRDRTWHPARRRCSEEGCRHTMRRLLQWLGAQACVDYLHLNARLPRHPHRDFRHAKVASSTPVSGTKIQQ
jgi:hypothetical protein